VGAVPAALYRDTAHAHGVRLQDHTVHGRTGIFERKIKVPGNALTAQRENSTQIQYICLLLSGLHYPIMQSEAMIQRLNLVANPKYSCQYYIREKVFGEPIAKPAGCGRLFDR
jgi:hypothetical protein